MARERWFVDGLELTDNLIHDIETFDGLYGAPPLEGANVSVPQRDGEIWVPKRLGPGSFTLRFWMSGGSKAEVDLNWEQILRHAVQRHKLVRFERQKVDGTIRECFGEVVSRITPTPIGQLGMRAAMDVVVPAGVWQDTVDANSGMIYLSPQSTASVNKSVNLTGFEGASAPMTTVRVAVAGMVQNLQITCPETGTWFRYDNTLPVGSILTVDAGADQIFGPNVQDLRYTGPYMFEVMPNIDNALPPKMTVTATQADHNATIRFVGRRRYQV